MRISFTGDIMCELPTLRKSKFKNGYNFEGMLSKSKLFDNTDYLVGNLETVLAGENAKFSKDIYSYNTPDSFIKELYNAGFNLLTTANNHCLDRGIDGLMRTMNLINSKNMDYIGTNKDANENRYRILKYNNIRIGFLAYTYGSNYSINKNKLDIDEKFLVNFIEDQEWIDFSRSDLYSKLKDNLISAELRVKILKLLNRNYNNIRIDNNKLRDFNMDLIRDIDELKKEADIIVMLMHSGGQFNKEPGTYTRKIVKKLKGLGVDIIVGHHPHVVQKYESDANFFAAYSLGNYFMSPDTIYLLNDNLPMYSVVLHMDILNRDEYKLSFSIAKTINIGSCERVIDTFELAKQNYSDSSKLTEDCKRIYETFTSSTIKDFKLKNEYEITLGKY